MKKFVVICTLSLMFAFAAMSEAATEWVRLVTDDAKGYVVSSHGNSATIDVGTSMGSRVGGLFLVYSEGNPVYDASGVLLSVEKIPLGVLKVRQAAGNFSMCGFVPPTNPAVIRPGDKVVPIAANVLKSLKFALAHPVLEPVYTEGFISQVPVEAVPAAAFGVPAAVPVAAPAPIMSAPAPVAAYPAPVMSAPVPAPAPVAYPAPVMEAPAPVGAYPAPMMAAPAPVAAPPAPPTITIDPAPYLAEPAPLAPQTAPQPYAPAPGGAAPYAPYPPSPGNPENYSMTLDFDSNSIADARLIRTFPLAQTEMNSLEIEFRGAWNLYVGNRFQEALSAFARQSGYAGNYLSPYWAGMSAWKLGDRNLAIAWFNSALEINPYFQPARNGLLNAVNNARPETAPPAGRTRKRR